VTHGFLKCTQFSNNEQLLRLWAQEILLCV